MATSPDFSQSHLATYLAGRREAMLHNWRTVCEGNPSLQATPSLSREEFNNKVPFMLNVLEQHLRGVKEEADIMQLSAQHGLHRWQKGYSLHELLEEMKHLHEVLLSELRLYGQLNPAQDRESVASDYEQIAWFSGLIIDGSVEQYANLQRVAATSQADTLQKALDHLNELTQERGDLLRQSAHDLRGSFGVIRGAAFLLDVEGNSPQVHREMVDMINRNLHAVHTMVSQLMDLARLESGQQPLTIQTFNISELLVPFVESLQSMAQERNLLLKVDGPANVMVESDPVLLQRIIQNLVLNALKHTTKGVVSVSWSRENDHRCVISVQDTGPGLFNEDGSPLAQTLMPAPETTSGLGVGLPPITPEEEKANAISFQQKGDGIGFSIVKRLCELLKASLEIETRRGEGSIFRIRLPLHWSA